MVKQLTITALLYAGYTIFMINHYRFDIVGIALRWHAYAHVFMLRIVILMAFGCREKEMYDKQSEMFA